MRTATTKVRRETYDLFQELCQKQGETPYSVLRDFVLAFVEHFSGGGEPAEAKPFTDWHTTKAAEVQDKPFTGWHTSGNR